MVFSFLKGAISSGVDSIREANKNRVKQLVLDESVSCNKCNSLAVPLYESENKYRCVGCGRQFSNSKHNLARKIRTEFGRDMKISYRKAVNEIGSQ
jgi:DNA-directed RNA polymerase subunit RPC12/RpoP